MSISVGDVVTLKIIEVSGYACWGEAKGKLGFVHCVEWSREKPVPEEKVPKVGQELKAKVFHIASSSDEQQPADVTLDGKYHIDFAASLCRQCTWRKRIAVLKQLFFS